MCGYQDLRVTRLAGSRAFSADVKSVARDLTPHLLRQLGYAARLRSAYSAINTDLQAVNSR